MHLGTVPGDHAVNQSTPKEGPAHCPIPAAASGFAAGCSAGTRGTAATCRGARPAIPYRVLVSEIMLQQTQVDRVLPKYEEWLDRYPTFEALAAADEQRRRSHLVPARLQHPAAPAAGDRARVGRALRRRAAGRRSDAAIVQGHRRLHGRRGHELRVRQARGDSRHERRARAVSRLRRQGRRRAVTR